MISEILSVESFVLTCLWQSMVLIVVGLAASFFLRRRSSRAHQILLLSIVAAVIVPAASSLVKHYELGMFVAEPMAIQPLFEEPTAAGDFSSSGPVAYDFTYEPDFVEENPEPVTIASQSAPLPWARIAAYGWIAVSLVLTIRLLLTFMLGVRLLGRAEPLDGEKMKRAMRSARARLGIGKDVEVRSSRAVRSPAIWCWRRRPVLLVPSAAWQSDNAVDWTAVLCHELAHWKRRDHISGLLAEIAVCILPWHLLLWWAKSRLLSLSEQACDDWVLATGQPGADYAESLLDLAPGGQMAFVPAVVSSKRGLADRVRRILKGSGGNPRTGAKWALAVSIAAGCIAVGVAFAQTRPAKPVVAEGESPTASPAGMDDSRSRTKLNQILDAMLYHDKAAMPIAMHVEIKMYDLRKPPDSAHRQTYSFEQRLDGRRLDSTMTVYRLEDGKRTRTQENRRVFTGSQFVYRQQTRGSLHVGLEPADEAKRVMAYYHLWGGVLLGYLRGDQKPVAAILKDSPGVTLRDRMEPVGDFLCHVIEGKTDHGAYKIWVDPEHDYRIRRSVVDKGPGDMWFGRPIPEGPPEGGSATATEHMEISDVKLQRIGDRFIPTAETLTATMMRTDGSEYRDRMAVTRSQIDLDPDFGELGAFVMDGVPDGARVANSDPQSHAYEYEFRNGKVVPVGDGGTIVGRLELSGDLGLDTILADNKLSFRASIQPTQTAENETEGRRLHSIYLYPTEDGSFRIENVPTGRCVLNVRLTRLTLKEMHSGSRMPYAIEIGSADREFSTPEKSDEAQRQSLDLGVLRIAVSEPGGLNVSADSNESMVSVNLKDADLKSLIVKLAAWTGKVIVPTAEAMGERVTIYAPKKLPKDDAAAVLLSALRVKGYTVDETESTIIIRPAPKEGPGEPSEGAGKDALVQRSYKLKNYSSAQMGRIIRPMLSDFGHLSSHEKTSTLSIIDTVERLRRIERVIERYDARDAEQLTTEIFQIRNGDPSDIARTISRMLRDPTDRLPATDAPGSASTATGPSGRPIVLIPEPTYRWIIVKGSSADLKLIAEWIEKLDKEERVEREYEIVQLGYVDTGEVADRLNEAIQQMPGTEMHQRVLIQPLPRTGQMIVFGPKDLLEIVKKLIAEIDIPPGLFETRAFELKYADADKVKENLERLYEQEPGYSYGSGGYSRRRRNVEAAKAVRVIAYPKMHQVTVIASPENMRKIADQIAEIDAPLDMEPLRPRIITLNNSDPAQMAELLTALFAAEGGGQANMYEIVFGKNIQEKRKTVGQLSGRLTFENVPGTSKLIVISAIAEAYDPVERLILELDKQNMTTKDVKEIRQWIERRGHEPGRTALPAGWTLNYDDGILAGGGRRWPANMAKDLASLEIRLKPYDPREASRKGEEYEFRTYSL
ncbi:MAG: secretin N-terminal domain-containing protein, partial [Planctomycetota bacterium]